MIKAIIFDMDGLLIDSEPFWREAEVAVFNAIGVPLREEMCMETIGVRIDEVVVHWHHRFPWDSEAHPFDQIAGEITERVIELVQQRGEAMPGVNYIHDFCRKRELRMALASSSSMRLIKAVLSKLELESNYEVIHSAEFEPFGKPHPGVYISTARQLELPPETCLALEDSVAGVQAAAKAGMRIVAVPDPGLRTDPRLQAADAVLDSLSEFDGALWRRLNQKNDGG